jgi:hypothetical protein
MTRSDCHAAPGPAVAAAAAAAAAAAVSHHSDELRDLSLESMERNGLPGRGRHRQRRCRCCRSSFRGTWQCCCKASRGWGCRCRSCSCCCCVSQCSQPHRRRQKRLTRRRQSRPSLTHAPQQLAHHHGGVRLAWEQLRRPLDHQVRQSLSHHVRVHSPAARSVVAETHSRDPVRCSSCRRSGTRASRILVQHCFRSPLPVRFVLMTARLTAGANETSCAAAAASESDST